VSPESLAALAGAAGGLAVLYGPLRDVASRAAARATCVLLLCGTALGWAVTVAPHAAAGAFLLSAVAVRWSHRAMGRRWMAARVTGAFLLFVLAIGVALAAEQALLRPPRFGESLFSSRHGLLFWNPVLWAGILGLPALWRREPRWTAGLGVGLAGGILVLACWPAEASGPWAAGRWLPLLPLLAPGLAASLDGLAKTAARTPARLLGGMGVLLVAWNLLFMEQYRSARLPRDATLSFAVVAENNAALLSGLVGSPPAWPANWVFAWRHGLPPDRFDLVSGKRLPALDDGAREVDVGDLGTDAALLLEGWSVRHPCGDAVCREVEGRARMLAPLEEPWPFDVSVLAAGEGHLSVAVNGVTVGIQPLTPELARLRFATAAPWRRLNEVSLAVAPGGHARVDRVRLERPVS
jgi:hypothetical protein